MSGSTLFLLLSAVLLLLTLATAQPPPPQSLEDVQITSVTGCVDVYPVTVNCSVATTTLRIQTAAGFPAVNNDPSRFPLYINARLNDYNYFTTTHTWLDPNDPTNSSVFVNVTASAYYPHITDALISISFIDYWSQPSMPTSPPFAGFSYRFEGPPTLTSIAGCEGSGQSTLNCVPDSAVIELTGSGLLWYSSAQGVQLNIGSGTSESLSSYNMQVVNDSYATLSLDWIYGSMLKPQHYAGVLLSINFTSSAYSHTGEVEYSYTTNSLQISFVPLPPPSIAYWQIFDCNETGFNLTTYTNCLPTVSQILLWGHYLYDVQVNVGGVPCPSAAFVADAQLHYCALPNFDFDPSIAYDLIAYNDAGQQTLSGLVQYTAAPTIASIDPCIDRGAWYEQFNIGVRCPSGTTITLRGSRFPAADAVTVQFVTSSFTSPSVSVTLLSPTLVKSSTITATLPTLDSVTAAAVYGARGTVQAVFTSSGVNTSTNAFSSAVYITPDAPNVTSITSTTCDAVSPLQLTNCRAMAVITVVGSNLFQNNRILLATSSAGGYHDYNYLLPSNSSIESSRTNDSLVFTLAYFDADTNIRLQPDVVYTVFLITINPVSWDVSNAFRLSLTYNTVGADSHSSSSGLSSGAIAGIVVAAVVVAAVLVLAVVWLVRRHGSGALPTWSNKSVSEGLQWSSQSSAQSPSDEYKDVEMR